MKARLSRAICYTLAAIVIIGSLIQCSGKAMQILRIMAE